MADISYDSLQLNISANVSGATKSIGALKRNLEALQNCVKGLDFKLIDNLQKHLQDIANIDFSNVSNGLRDVVSAFKALNSEQQKYANKSAKLKDEPYSPNFTMQDKQLPEQYMGGQNWQDVAYREIPLQGWKDFTDNLKDMSVDAKEASDNVIDLESTMKDVGEQAEKSAGKFSKLLGAFKRIAFYRIVRRLLQLIVQSIKEGLDNLAMFDSSFNETMSNLKSSFTYLKNSLGAMLAPLIKALEPFITLIVDAVSYIANLLGQIFSMVLGQDTFTQAIKGAEDYAEALKKAKNAQLGLDELNVIQQDKQQENFETIENENSAVNSLGTLLQSVKDFLQGILSSLGQLIEPLMGLIQSVLLALDPIFGVLSELINSLTPVISNIIQMLVPIINEIIGILSPILEILGEIAGDVLGMVVEALKPILEVLSVFLKPVLQAISDTLRPLKVFLETLFGKTEESENKNFFERLILALGNMLKSIFGLDGEKGFFQNLAEGIGNALTSFFGLDGEDSFFYKLFHGLIEGIKGLTKSAFGEDSLIYKLIDFVEKIYDFVNDILKGLKKFTWGIIEDIKEGFDNAQGSDSPTVVAVEENQGENIQGQTQGGTGNNSRDGIPDWQEDPRWKEMIEAHEHWSAGDIIMTITTLGIYGIIKAIANAVAENRLQKQLIAEHEAKAKEVAETTRKILKIVINNAISSFSPLGIFEPIINFVVKSFEVLKQKLSSLFNFGAITDLFANVGNTISTTGENVKNWLSSLGEKIGNFFGINNVAGYATGGFVEDGFFFANHNELVGQFSNGKTAVANNEQITEGIYRAVLQAFSESGSNEGHRDIILQIDGREIGRASEKYQRQKGAKIFSGGQ